MSWAVAVSGDAHSGAVGGGVVIGACQVLTCAGVCAGLIDGNGEPTAVLWVRFPGGGPREEAASAPGPPSRRVIGVQWPQGERDLAILILEHAVPPGVVAARLRRPGVPSGAIPCGSGGCPRSRARLWRR